MKSAHDPRHQKRRDTVKELFAFTFSDSQYISDTTKPILVEIAVIDDAIRKAAPAWPIEKLNRIDLAILRLAVYELNHKIAPPKVSIDEAVELAKEFGSESSPSFINGVLGTILKEIDTEI